MELYFEEIATKMPGYEEFQKEAWSFKVIVILSWIAYLNAFSNSLIVKMCKGSHLIRLMVQNQVLLELVILLVSWNYSRYVNAQGTFSNL